MLSKSDIRLELLRQRKTMDPSEYQRKSHSLFVQFKNYFEFIRSYSDLVFGLYFSVRNEVDTTEIFNFLKSCNVKIAYPQMKGIDLEFKEIDSLKELKAGQHGIFEPQNEKPLTPTHCLVPGVAFDGEGYRLGYGAGYYDRYFEKNPKTLRIGAAFNFQIIQQFPHESHDIPMQIVLTEDKLLRC